MFSVSSPLFINRQVWRPTQRLEPEFGLPSLWASLEDDKFIMGNHGFRRSALMPTYFIIDKSDVNEGRMKRKKKDCCTNGNTKRFRKEEQADDPFSLVVQSLTGFKPDEIDVSTDGDRLKIHARSDSINGITSEIFKWYSLPGTVDTEQLTSSLSQNGTLHVTAPLKKVVKETETVPDKSSEINEQMKEATDKELELDGKSTEEIKERPKTVSKTEFHVELPMEKFKPEHVKVSVEDDILKIYAKKVDECEGHFVQEEVTKWLNLPSDVDVSQLVSNIRDDKVLLINAPKKNEALASPTKVADDTEMMTDDNATDHAQEG